MYSFGSFHLDPQRRRLLRDGEPLALTPRALDVLRLLVEHRGEVVSRDDLLASVWHDVVVEEGVLTQNVYTLRRLLDRGDGGSAIETVRGLGYRLALPVREVTERASAVRALAVLPFEPLGLGEEGAVLGLAMADSLITRLARLRGLMVRPTSAVRGVDSSDADPLELGRALKVDAVVSGTLQRAGGRLRISAQLLRDELGSPLWTASRDTGESDLFAAQDALADELIATLGLDLSSGDRAELSRRQTDRPAAYRAFARGRYFWNKRAGRDLQRAIEAFDEALSHDPRYARAYAGLADAYVLLPFYAGVDPRDAFPQARAAATRALEIDDRLAEAHNSLAYTRFLFDWEFAGAEEAFARALALDPDYATARHWHGFYLSAMGRHGEAIAEMRRATELDPLSLVIHSDLALVLYFARRHEEAVAQARAALELDERFAYAYFALCLASCQLERLEEAVEAGEQAARLSQRSPLMLAVLAHAMALAGREPEAEGLVAELRGHRETKPGHLALVEAARGCREETLAHLEQALERRSRFVVLLAVWPAFDALRGQPRLGELIARVGLPGDRAALGG